MRKPWQAFAAFGRLLAAALLIGCATGQAPSAGEEQARSPMDKVLARLVSKGELEKAQRAVDSLTSSRDPAEREIAAYWKAVTWLYRDEPDSALALLEPSQSKWTGGLRKVHAGLLLMLAREASQNKAARGRPIEIARAAPSEKAAQDKIESLLKETCDLRAENARLETEKEKYQKLLKDLEKIR
ncbi:MAG: hypothetical protein ABI036_18070 [Fibrobacteria bacterium]